jgi:dsDNA-binding SOS-regulon protein
MFVLSASFARCASPTLTLTEQEVIEALLPQAVMTRHSKKHVIEDTTSVRMLQMGKDYDSFSEGLRQEAKHSDEPFREALDDFLKKNKADVQIVFPTNAPKSVELVSAATLKEIFAAKPDAKPNGWDIFYQRFPDADGLIRISRVGIDSKSTVAIIYLGQQSGYLAGRGGICVLRREGGKWVYTRHEVIGPGWVS